MRDLTRRFAWVAVLVVGLALYFIVLETLIRTQNPNFVPTLILLGASVVPAAFITFAQAHTGERHVPLPLLAVAAFFGGVVGVVVAGILEYDTLRGLGTLPTIVVAVVEETAKLLVPALLLAVLVRRDRRAPTDGIIIGIACGVGFAALETMGYAFTALLESQGNIGAVEQTLFIRGLTSPAGHTAWTGLTCGALWVLISNPHIKNLLIFLATFVGVVALHTAWDSFGTTLAYVVLATVSLGWLALALRHYRHRTTRTTAPLPAHAR